MKKLLFMCMLASMYAPATIAQNNNVLLWHFKNTTGLKVDGITVEHIEGTSIQNISVGTQNIAPPQGFAIVSSYGQKKWHACNFRIEMANNGVVKLEIKNTPAPGIGGGVIVRYFWTKNGQRIGKIQSAKTDFTGTIPTQLGWESN